MPDCLEPERVSIRDIPGWVSESWSLLWRRPLGFFGASILYHLLALAARSIPYLSLLVSILLCYILLLLLIRLADSADLGRAGGFIPAYATIRKTILSLLALSLLYLCIFMIAAVVAALLLPQQPAGQAASPPLAAALRWIGPGEVAFMILFMGVIVTSGWFVAPLLALHELGTGDARALAKRAFNRNDIVILVASNLPFFAILALAALSELSLLLSLGIVPLFSIYQYVTYRHVFLGRKQNQPVTARANAGRIAQSALH